MASQSSSQTSQGLSHGNSQTMIQTFSSPVAIKFDEENYLPWKQQAEATIEGHDLLNHIIGKGIPKQYTSEDDQENDAISAEYQH